MSFDIVVGIPSYNEGENIKFVAEQIDKGLKKYFKDKKAVIVNCDGNSKDNTTDFFLSSKTQTGKIVLKKENITGKGNVFRQLFEFIKASDAKACIVVDADLKSITPEWVKYMLEPIYKGYDYLTPYYSRHKYDGTITNNICYPIIYSLFSIDIRQPIGGDFSFSGKMADYWLKQKWSNNTCLFGIDIFMTINAIKGNFKIAQVNLGTKKHKPSAPNLSTMFLQVVDALFSNIDLKNIDLSEEIKETKIFGMKKLETSQELSVDEKSIREKVLEEYANNKEIIKSSVSYDDFKMIDGNLNKNKISIESDLWSKIVYDCLISYKKGNTSSIRSLQILYFARVFSFIEETKKLSNEKAEKMILKQAEIFNKNKEYLIKNG